MTLQAYQKHHILNKAIVEHLKFELASQGNSTHPSRDYFRGSETDACARKIMYARTGQTRSLPLDPSAQEKMRKGDRYQDYIRELIHQATDFDVVHVERPLTGTFTAKDGTVIKLSGRIDGVLLAPVGESSRGTERALLEVKTTSHWGMMGLKKAQFKDPEHYTWGYVLQCHRYIAMWNAAFPDEPISKFCLYVYDVNGDACEETDFPAIDYWYKFNPKIWEQEVERLATIERHIQASSLPARHYAEIDWQCTGCSYFFDCWPKRERVYAAPKHAKRVEELEKAKKRRSRKRVSGGAESGTGSNR